jgi:hypothetical protein
MPLFVVMEPGHDLTDELRAAIASAIRTHASPRHVPDTVIAVPAPAARNRASPSAAGHGSGAGSRSVRESGWRRPSGGGSGR